MRKRVFIAINLPEEIKKELFQQQKEWKNLPIRWTPKENLHITLVFIGYINNQQLKEISFLTNKAVNSYSSFVVRFKKICLAPPNRSPRMVWLEIERSLEMLHLKQSLEELFLKNSQKTGFFEKERRLFSPHITLGRIRIFEWNQLKKKPQIEKKFFSEFRVNSVEIMESLLSREGAKYSLLESIQLSNIKE